MQRGRLAAVFADERHVELQTAWAVYQDVVAAYRNPDRRAGKAAVVRTIDGTLTRIPGHLF